MKKETKFQSELIKEIKARFPGCVVLKTDANSMQGISDLLILYNSTWGMLECKRYKEASRRPNQEYYVNKFNGMSFASFIYPENRKEVLDEMESTFALSR